MLEQLNFFLTGILVPLLICSVGIFYAVKLKLFHIIKPMSVLRGLKSEKASKGVSSASAVTLALAGTLGVGNIVGVSSAIYLGGFGSVFWMWISALLAMILKYAEIVIAMRHRNLGKNGKPFGSAMLYIKDFFHSHALDRLGKIIAAIFAIGFILCSLTMGSMLQASAISESFSGVLNVPSLFTAVALAILTLVISQKGTHGIIKITNILVPFMSIGYTVMSLAIILKAPQSTANAFSLIFSSAFDFRAVFGGVGGYTFTQAIRYGVMRGLVSNEAGCGTAPTAHAIAECKSPARQGMWGIFEVFADTVILCTMTALCVISEYNSALKYGGNYMMMTLSAYSSGIGHYAEYFLCASVFFFGFATIACWIHYGLTAVEYFSSNKLSKQLFIITYAFCVFIGSCISSELSWQLADMSMGIMTVINLTVIVCMWKEVKYETDIYLNSLENKKTARYTH